MTAVLTFLVVVGAGILLAGFVWNAWTAARRRLGAGEAAGVGKRRHGFSHQAFMGRAEGVAWSDEITFGELKRGVRDGTWRRSPRLQQFLLMLVGAAILLVGLALLIGWHTGPVGLGVAIATIGYVAVQVTRGFLRA